MILFSGSGNLPFAEALANELRCAQGRRTMKRFSDGELYVNIDEADKVAGEQVLLVQSFQAPVEERLLEFLLLADALTRLHPRELVGVVPFFPYRRQERKVEAGESVSAALMARLFEAAGVDRLIVVDLHARETTLKFFKIPVVQVQALPRFIEYFKAQLANGKQPHSTVVVAQDRGALPRATAFADALGLPIAVLEKSRGRMHDAVADLQLVEGSVADRDIIMIDDEINTGGSIVGAAALLKAHDAKRIFVAATHAVLSGHAIDRLRTAPFEEIVFADTVPVPEERRLPNMKFVRVVPAVAVAIKQLSS